MGDIMKSRTITCSKCKVGNKLKTIIPIKTCWYCGEILIDKGVVGKKIKSGMQTMSLLADPEMINSLDRACRLLSSSKYMIKRSALIRLILRRSLLEIEDYLDMIEVEADQ